MQCPKTQEEENGTNSCVCIGARYMGLAYRSVITQVAFGIVGFSVHSGEQFKARHINGIIATLSTRH